MTDEERKLWDRFAMVALQGFLTHPEAAMNWSEETLAECSYRHADAMLAERERRLLL